MGIDILHGLGLLLFPLSQDYILEFFLEIYVGKVVPGEVDLEFLDGIRSEVIPLLSILLLDLDAVIGTRPRLIRLPYSSLGRFSDGHRSVPLKQIVEVVLNRRGRVDLLLRRRNEVVLLEKNILQLLGLQKLASPPRFFEHALSPVDGAHLQVILGPGDLQDRASLRKLLRLVPQLRT